MANATIQYPNIDLPGAEFFSLAPNRTIAIQGRRSRRLNSVVAAIPPESFAFPSVDIVMENNFTNTSGVYVHFAALIFFGDSNGALQIQGFGTALSLQAGDFTGYPLGVPTLTTLEPIIGMAIMIDRDRLVTAQDLSFGGVYTNTGKLHFNSQAAIFNPQPAAGLTLNTVTTLEIVWSRLDGFVT